MEVRISLPILKYFFYFGLIFALIGCAHQPESYAYNPPGFWSGLIHGLIIPLSLIGSLFMDIRIYAFPNSGVWYDFGFVVGGTILSFFGLIILELVLEEI